MATNKKSPTGGASGVKGRKKNQPEPPPAPEPEVPTFREFSPNDSSGMRDYLSGIFNESSKSWDTSTQTAVDMYKGASYGSFNDPLRAAWKTGKMPSPGSLNMIRNLDKAAAPLQEGVIVYRGFNSQYLHNKFKKGSIVGDAFEDAGYMSTSIGSQSAGIGMGKDTQLRIRVPKGTKAIVPNPNGNHGSEQEIILHRNTRLRITKAEMVNGTLRVEADYIGEGIHGKVKVE